jgi:hypothetical protein
MAIALASGALPTLEVLLRRTAQEPQERPGRLLSQLQACNILDGLHIAAVAHGPERAAAALAYSTAKGALMELARAVQQQAQPQQQGAGLNVELLGNSASQFVRVARQPVSSAKQQLCGMAYGMVCSLGAAFAAGLPMPAARISADGVLDSLTYGQLRVAYVAAFVAVTCLGAPGHSPAGGEAGGAARSSWSGAAGGGPATATQPASLSWRQVLLQLRPLELLQCCFAAERAGGFCLRTLDAVTLAVVAAGVTLALPAETRAAVLSASRSSRSVSLQPAALLRMAKAAQDAGSPVPAAAAAVTVTVWEAWQASPPPDAAVEAALLAQLRASLGWGHLQLPWPSPAEALALLHPCSNPLCTELGGDSETRVQLKACARCGAVAYCCRCGEAGCGACGAHFAKNQRSALVANWTTPADVRYWTPRRAGLASWRTGGRATRTRAARRAGRLAAAAGLRWLFSVAGCGAWGCGGLEQRQR